MRELYPPCEPYEAGMLDVGDGHRIYFERCGRQGAKPALFLHGGPGGGCLSADRQLFDPERYDVVFFDQRGCGRSTPHASLEANTTDHLLEDIECLRRHLGVERWLLVGGSWGATVALLYAQQNPDRVSGLVLRGIFLATESEFDWCYQKGASEFFPREWDEFLAAIPEEERYDILGSFRRRLTGRDEHAQLLAARAWARWESVTTTLVPDERRLEKFSEPEFALAFARIESHYFANGAWLRPEQIVSDAGRLRDIPGAIVQGRYDLVCPPRNAYRLHRAWPSSELHMIEAAGHSLTEPGILEKVLELTDRFAA